jgi:nitrate reductase gamma subunit
MHASLDLLLLTILPYVAVVVAVTGTIERYRRHAYSCTSLSSQFIENRQHFWGIVPFHAGILVVLAAHLLGAILPRQTLALSARPSAVFVLEATLLAFGSLGLIGFLMLSVRRTRHAVLRSGTTALDVVVYALLLAQLAGGVAIAVLHTWGSGWYAAVGVPYLWSLARLQPEISAVAALPWLVKLHIIGAWLIVGLFPFSRLVHIVAVPNAYLWRRPQVVRWYRSRPAGLGR